MSEPVVIDSIPHNNSDILWQVMSYMNLSCFSVQDKERDVHQPYGGQSLGREHDKSADKHDKADVHKDGKKKEEKLKWRKRKLLGPGVGGSLQKTEHRVTGGELAFLIYDNLKNQ